MSILIKGMKMPKCCSDCLLNYDQMACTVTGTRWWSDRMVLMDFDSDKERLYDCPLVEIPTPHGRLIDAKFVYEICGEKQGRASSIGEMQGISKVWKAVKRLPTVIEAEGSEK